MSSALLTREEGAEHCRVSLRTFDQHVRHAVPAVRIGRRVLFAREDLEGYIEQKRACAFEKQTVRPIRPYAGRPAKSKTVEPEIPSQFRVKRPTKVPAWCLDAPAVRERLES